MSAALAARLVADGVVKGDRVALLAPNGIEWAAIGLAVMRIGAVLVPLSTLLRPPELLAQLTTANVSHLVTAAEFRGRRYVDELEEASPGLRAPSAPERVTRRHLRCAGSGRTDGIPDAGVPISLVRALEGARAAGRRPGRPLHLGIPGNAQGRHPHPWGSVACGRIGTRCPWRGSGRAPLHPDALLLDRRVRARAADRAGGRRHPADRSRARAGVDARAPPTRASDAVPWLAGSGGSTGCAAGLRRGRPVLVAGRELAAVLPPERRPAPGPGPISSA